MNKISLIKRCVSFLISENKWSETSKYGLLAKTAMLKKPLLIADPQRVYIHPYSRLQSHAKILNYTGRFILKPYAVCSDNLLVVTGNHVPTVGIPQFFLGSSHINDRERDVIVDEGAWIGANVTLLSGTHIGRGAVVAACSVIKESVPPYSVVSGNPAKIIATVFPIEMILEHERMVFKEEDRLSEEFLRDLFDSKYVGLKSIGTRRVKDSDRTQYDMIVNFVSTFPYAESDNPEE